MSKMKRTRLIAAIVLIAVASIGAFAEIVYGASGDNANTRAIVAFVGDSNITLADGQIGVALADGTHLKNSYVPILLHRSASGIRTSDCADSTCGTYDYWNRKLVPLWPKLSVDAIVVNLGINDALSPGGPTGPGYSTYGQKIDWMLNQLPAGVPVYWTNLPCSIEPETMVTGCKEIDIALTVAKDRWPNLTVLPWATTAKNHTEYMLTPGSDVHYSLAGNQAWATLVVDALDSRFP